RLDQLHELGARLGAVAEGAEHRRRHRLGVLLLLAAHEHAEVDRFHDHGDAPRLERFVQRIRDLGRESLLHLQPPAVHLDEPRDLREADDLLARHVRDVGLAKKWDHMMLTIVPEMSADEERRARLAREAVDRVRLLGGWEPANTYDARIGAVQRQSFSPIARDTVRTRNIGTSLFRKLEGTVTRSIAGSDRGKASANIARYFSANSARFTVKLILRPCWMLPSAATAPRTYPSG